jgi:hypothetical protein
LPPGLEARDVPVTDGWWGYRLPVKLRLKPTSAL